jgi:hypothetical protein
MDQRLDQLLATQDGVATTDQLMTCLTRRELAHILKTGQLQKIWYGVYARPDPGPLTRLRALDLTTGTRVAACLGTAAALHGFDTEDTRDLHVLNPPRHQLRMADGLVVHRRYDAPLVMLGGRLVTAPGWTAVEVARGLHRPRALATLDAALRSGTCTPGGLRHAVALQAGRRGIVAVRDLVPLANAASESPMESEARLVMLDGGLPPPVLQYEIVGVDGEVWRVDFAWPELRVAAEYDSVEWHGDAEALRRDRRRYQALREAGWVVVPILADDVRRFPQELIWRIAGEMRRAAA